MSRKLPGTGRIPPLGLAGIAAAVFLCPVFPVSPPTPARGSVPAPEAYGVPDSLPPAGLIRLADSLAVAGRFEEPGGYERATVHHAAELAVLERLVESEPDSARARAHRFNRRSYELSVAARMQGDLPRALSYLERNEAMTRSVYGDDHYTLAWTYNAMGNVEHDAGRFGAAVSRYEDALDVAGASLSGDDGSLAPYLLGVRRSICNNLAMALVSIGDYEGAESAYRRALDQDPETGPERVERASTLANLADLYRIQGRIDLALSTHDRAAALVDADSLRNLPLHVDLLAYRARALVAAGRVAEGRSAMESALRRFTAFHDSSHFDYAWLLGEIGNVLDGCGEEREALGWYGRAVASYGRNLGAEHPRVGELHRRMALAHRRLGEEREATAQALEAERISRDHRRLVLGYLDELSGLALARATRGGLDVALSLADRASAEDRRRIWSAVVRSRGLVQDVAAERVHRLRHDPSGAGARYASVSRRLAHLTLRGLLRPLDADDRDLMEALRRERDVLARTVVEADGDAGSIGPEDVFTAIPGPMALVSFVTCSPPEGGDSGGFYGAFVARRPDSVRFHRLGAIDSLDTAIRNWVAAARSASRLDPLGAEEEARRLGARVRRMIWDPLQPDLDGAEGVLVVPDRAVNLVSFDALPLPGGRYLIEEPRSVRLLGVERDLAAGNGPEAGSGVLAVGGLDFDRETAGASPATAAAGELRDISCEAFRDREFAPLPGSGSEVLTLEKLWRERNPGEEVVVLTGSGGDKATVLALAPGHRVLHFATHGFVLEASCLGNGASRDPLILAGLVLSGGNRGGKTADGILTAAEVATLDLKDTEVVVLSACDTGAGEIVDGEGVLGLRRAFRRAGAGALVVSLWPVGDRFAREWMDRYYRSFLTGLPVSEAARLASRGMLDSLREEGRSTHPAGWAGFVTTGVGLN